jgi:hypothetical protein
MRRVVITAAGLLCVVVAIIVLTNAWYQHQSAVALAKRKALYESRYHVKIPDADVVFACCYGEGKYTYGVRWPGVVGIGNDTPNSGYTVTVLRSVSDARLVNDQNYQHALDEAKREKNLPGGKECHVNKGTEWIVAWTNNWNKFPEYSFTYGTYDGHTQVEAWAGYQDGPEALSMLHDISMAVTRRVRPSGSSPIWAHQQCPAEVASWRG